MREILPLEAANISSSAQILFKENVSYVGERKDLGNTRCNFAVNLSKKISQKLNELNRLTQL